MMDYHYCRRVSSTPSIMTRGKSWDGASLVLSIMSRLDLFSIVKCGKFYDFFLVSIKLCRTKKQTDATQRSTSESGSQSKRRRWGSLYFLVSIRRKMREIRKIQLYHPCKICTHFLYCAGCGGDQPAEEVFKSAHYSFHRSL